MSSQKPVAYRKSFTVEKRKPGFLRRLFPDLGFYISLCSIIWRRGQQAKKGTYTGDDWAISSNEVIQLLERYGCSLEVTGIETVAALDEPVVFIGNHMSTLETFVLPALIQPLRDVTFVVKESLLKYPCFGPILAARKPVTVRRTSPREDLAAILDGGSERLAAGRSVIVFPQSTRTSEFNPAHFNTIGVKLARRAGVPVIPLALKTDAWGNDGKLIKDFGKFDPRKGIHFAFGEKMNISGTGKTEHKFIVDFIQKNLENWKAQDQRG